MAPRKTVPSGEGKARHATTPTPVNPPHHAQGSATPHVLAAGRRRNTHRAAAKSRAPKLSSRSGGFGEGTRVMTTEQRFCAEFGHGRGRSHKGRSAGMGLKQTQKPGQKR